MGYFKDGNPTGEWQFRDIEFSYEPPNFNRRIANRHNDVITKRYTLANPEDTLKAFHPLIRKGLIKVNYDDNESFELSASETLPFLNQNLFDVAFEQEEQLDLEEELFDSHSLDRKSTRLNSSHITISYSVFCLKKKKHILQKKHNKTELNIRT